MQSICQIMKCNVPIFIHTATTKSISFFLKEIEKGSENTRFTLQANEQMRFQKCKNGQVIAASTSKYEPS